MTTQGISLYELEEQYRELHAMLLDDDIDAEAVTETLKTVEGGIAQKVLSYARVVKSIEADCDAIAAEVKRLQDRKAARLAKVARMKDAMKDALEAISDRKVSDALFTVAVQKNPPSVAIYQDMDIPETYKRYEPVIDKRAILDALKAGETVPGCELKQGESVRIR